MKNNKGFTLIEILLVIAILSVLLLIFIPKGSTSVKNNEVNVMKLNAEEIETAFVYYYGENQSYPDAGSITQTVSVNTQTIIDQKLNQFGSTDTYNDLVSKNYLKKIDINKIRTYLKSSEKINDFFYISDGALKGRVFSYTDKSNQKGLVYSGNYQLEIDPSMDETIRLPLAGDGTSSNPYIITTVGELQGMKLCDSCFFELGRNINAINTKNWNNGEGFEPIGMVSEFMGSLDGKGYKISGLYINRPSLDGVGLFSSVNGNGGGQTFQNITILNGNVTGYRMTALFIGYSTYGTVVKNVHVKGYVTSSEYYVGGLIGDANGTTINNSSSSGTLYHSGGYYIGGLVGGTSNTTITSSYSTMDVNTYNQGFLVGGLVGQLWGSTITKSYATGNVTGVYSDGGGLVGETNSSSKITESFATGNVSGYQDHTGGFAGYIANSIIQNNYSFGNSDIGTKSGGFAGEIGSLGTTGNVSNNYSVGKATGSTVVGGFVPKVATGAVSKVTNNYWDTTISGNATSASGTGMTTTQMKTQSTFSGWDFVNTWSINSSINNGYPYLKNNIPN